MSNVIDMASRKVEPKQSEALTSFQNDIKESLAMLDEFEASHTN